jgi:hypothetical protein
MKSNWLKWILVAAVVTVGVAAAGFFAWRSLAPSPTAQPVSRELVYIVPRGAITEFNLGQRGSLLPNEIELTVGGIDTLVVRNEDLYPIDVAGVYLHPGQSYRQQFTRPGQYDLDCSVHTDDIIRVIVHPPSN